MHWRRGTIDRLLRSWTGTEEYAVRLDVPEVGTPPLADEVRAVSYVAVTGPLAPGQRVLLNVSSLVKGLGTGGFALVVAPVDDVPEDPASGAESDSGHIVKARYTPQQQLVFAADEQGSPHHELIARTASLGGVPVVVADLHSALPAIVAGIRGEAPGARVAYVMTDGASLPMAFSHTVAGLVDAGWLATTVTCGQAFGGQLETVSLHTGLLAAVAVSRADVIVVAQGPGNAGTGTPWGFSGVAVADALTASHVLGGVGIASLRISGADARERHHGISHHSLTAYGRALLAPATVPVPDLDGALGVRVRAQAAQLARDARAVLTLEDVAVDGLGELLRSTPVGLSTMGRGLEQDPAAFLAAAAAGRVAARLLSS